VFVVTSLHLAHNYSVFQVMTYYPNIKMHSISCSLLQSQATPNES